MSDILEKLIKQNLELSPDAYWHEILSAQILFSNKNLVVLAACMSGRPDLLNTLITDFGADKHQSRFDSNYKVGLLEDTLRAFIERKDIDRSDIGKNAFIDVIKILTRRTTQVEKVELFLNEPPLKSALMAAHFLANPEWATDNTTPHFDMVVDTYNQKIPEKWDEPYNHLKRKYPDQVQEFESALDKEITSLRAKMNVAADGLESDESVFRPIENILPPAPKSEEPK